MPLMQTSKLHILGFEWPELQSTLLWSLFFAWLGKAHIFSSQILFWIQFELCDLHSFPGYLLTTYYMPSTVLEVTGMSEAVSRSWKWPSSGRMTENEQGSTSINPINKCRYWLLKCLWTLKEKKKKQDSGKILEVMGNNKEPTLQKSGLLQTVGTANAKTLPLQDLKVSGPLSVSHPSPAPVQRP